MKRDIEFLRDVGLAVIPAIVVYVLSEIELLFFSPWGNIDYHLHFLGGASIAAAAFILWRRWTKRKWMPVIPSWFVAWTILSTVALAGVIWEFREWTNDHFFHTVMQQGLTDTMNDLGMDLLGGMVFIAIAAAMRRLTFRK